MKVYIRSAKDPGYDLDTAFTDNVWERRRQAQETKSPELLDIYAYDPSLDVRVAAISNSHVSKDTLISLADDPMPAIRETVARHNKTPVELLVKLSNDPESSVRGAAVRNIHYPQGSTLDYATDADVQEGLIGNKNTPEEVKVNIAGITDSYWVLDTLAQSRRSSAEVLRQVVQNPAARYWTKQYVAQNPNADESVLLLLAADPTPAVRTSLAKRENLPDAVCNALARDTNATARTKLALNPTTPPAILERLADDKSTKVKAAVAENSNTPYDTLLKLADSPSIVVKRGMARHRDLPAHLIRKIFNPNDWDITVYLASRSTDNVPSDIIDQIVDAHESDEAIQKLTCSDNISTETLRRIASRTSVWSWWVTDAAYWALWRRGEISDTERARHTCSNTPPHIYWR